MWDYPRLRTIFVACSPFYRCRKRPKLYAMCPVRRSATKSGSRAMKRGASRPILRSCRNCYVRIDVGFCTQRGQRVQNYKGRGRRPWVKPRQCISTARIAMRFITLSEPRLDQRPFIVRVPCRVCDAPLPGRDGDFVLKYFLLRNALRPDPRAREGSQRAKPVARQKRPPAD
jgi:hypothetical protein